jgi:hypothetical protein
MTRPGWFSKPAADARGIFHMQFTTSRPDIVRSDSQRRLLAHWNSLRGAAPLPIWQGLDETLMGASADLSLTEIVAAGDILRFQIRFHGTRLAELYGRTSCVGKFLDEVLPPAYSEAALGTYRQAVATSLPVYTVADMRNREARIVHYERLLLPYGSDGVTADRILASLEIVSPEGEFDHRELMKSPEKGPAFAFLTTIQH